MSPRLSTPKEKKHPFADDNVLVRSTMPFSSGNFDVPRGLVVRAGDPRVLATGGNYWVENDKPLSEQENEWTHVQLPPVEESGFGISIHQIDESEAVWCCCDFSYRGRQFRSGTKYRKDDADVVKFAANFEQRRNFAELLAEEVK